MTEGDGNDMDSGKTSTIERLLGGLPEEKAPPTRVWERVESAITEKPALGGLAQEVAPERDLWPAIDARLRAEPRELSPVKTVARGALALWAASLAVVAITGFVAFGLYQAGGGPNATRQQVAATGADLTEDVSSDATVGGNAGYFLPAATTAPGIEAQATYRESIALVQSQRLQIEASLEVYPTDPALHELWRHAYETELRLIDEAGRLLTTI